MHRRKFLQLAASAAAAGPLLSACGSSSGSSSGSDGPVTLTVSTWSMSTTPEFKALFDAFQKLYPNITIKPVDILAADYRAAALIDEHVCWEEIAPTHERLGACRCHTPEPVAVTGLDAQMLTPGQPRTARYAYLLTPAGLRVEVRVNGDWLKLGRASYTRETGRIRFDLMAERARELREAHAWDTDPAN